MIQRKKDLLGKNAKLRTKKLKNGKQLKCMCAINFYLIIRTIPYF